MKNGIRKNQNGVYCFPITGHISLDRWWMKALKRYRNDGKRYNGFIFRLVEQDLPAYFGHFMGATIAEKFEMPIRTLKDLGIEIQNTIIWRIGERTQWNSNQAFRHNLDYLKLGQEELATKPQIYKETLNDAAMMEYILEDYQIVLSNSIKPNRIIRVISSTGEFSRVLYKENKVKYIDG